MASRQSVSSILKPSKVRAPLKEIEPVDQDADENTESLPKRKVSFSGMNKIKMYNTGATSLTVHQAPMFDEQISILSDSSNAEKTKLLLEASQKSNQTTIESRNCTTMEDNNRVCVEYECPNDNMEMTEALSCKIFSDTIYTTENNGFEHGDYNSDYSDSNMEFTEVIKTAQILTNENDSDFSSTETLNDNNKHPDAQSSNMELTCVTSFQKSILPHYKSDMELTELTERKIHENNCELVFEQDQHSISTTSEISSDISMDIDQTSEGNDINCIIDNSKLLVSAQNDSLIPKPTEYEQHNYSDLLIDIDNQNIQPSPSLVSTGLSFFSEMLDSNKPSIVEELKEDILNTNTSTVDQHHSSENNEIKIYSRKSMAHTKTLIVDEKSTKNKYVLNTSVVVKENDQKNYFTESQTLSLEKENTSVLEENQQINALVSIHNESKSSKDENNVSDLPVVVKSQQKRSRKSIAPTLFHNEYQSSENDELSNIPVMLKENQQSNAPVLVHHESQSSENDETLNTLSTLEENQQKRYSRKSIAPTLFHNEYQSSENDEISNTSVILEENQQSNAPVLVHHESQSSETLNTLSTLEENQQKRSRKSIAPTLFHNEYQSSENDKISNTSVILEENQQKIYSQQSNASVLVHHESQSSENDETLNTLSTIEENQQKRYSRKSIAPTLFHNEYQSSENDEISNTSVILEENQQSNAPVLVHHESQSSETLNTLSTLEENQQKRSRKSIAPTLFHNEYQSSENDKISNTSVILEENQQKIYSQQSNASVLVHHESQSSENDETLNTLSTLEENQQKRYSRKSIAPTRFHNESQSSENDEISNTPIMLGENQQKRYSQQSNVPVLIHNGSSQSSENDETLNTLSTLEEKQQNKYSRKSVAPLSIHNESKSSKDENNVSDSPVVVKSQQKKYSRKSLAPALFSNESQSSENNEISNAPVLIHNESQSYEDEDQSNASMSLHNESQSFGDEDISDTPVVVEENQQKIYCRKSIAPTLDFNESKFSESEGMSNQTRSPIIRDLLDTSVTVKANRPKKYSRKTVGPSSLLVHREPSKYIECDNNIMDEEESNKSNSRMSMPCVTTKCISDTSLLSDYSTIKLLDLTDEHENKFISKTELKPVFSNMNVDDDFSSPFRKKSRLSVALTNSKSETAIENNALENYGETCTMDISVELSNDNSMLNMSSKELNKSYPSCLFNDISQVLNVFEKKLEVSDKSSRKEKYLNDLTENIEKLEKVKHDSLQISDSNMVNHSLKFEDNSIPHNVNRIVNDICTEGLSNISISNKTHANYEKSFTENRKRSYTNRDINYEESAMENDFEVVSIKEDSFNENLNNEVIEFLEKWEKQFIDKILVKVKCTNSKWIFEALNDNIILTIKYFPILEDHNFLKVEDISFTTKNIIHHEIIKFGINWILSKYDPKVYKQVCFSSRDIELLLKSLLEDVKYISKMMNNMFYVSDMYCVKFKDNLAQFCLYSMKCLSMTSIQISLANIHKLSVKDITVNCLFGSFNINLLNEILKELPKDYNILESLIIKLKDQMYR